MAAPHSIDVAELLELQLQGASPDLLRQMIVSLANAMMSAHADQGPRRAMFASNFPVDRPAVTFGRLVAAAAEAAAHLPAADRAEFFAGTAMRTYRLDGSVLRTGVV